MQGSAYNVGLPPQQTQNIAPTAGAITQDINQLGPYGNVAQGTLPYAQQTAMQQYNNPYASQMQGAANQISPYGMQGAMNQFGAPGTS